MFKLILVVLISVSTIVVSYASTVTVEDRAYAMLNKLITEYSRNMCNSVRFPELNEKQGLPKLDNITLTNCTLNISKGMQLVKVRTVSPDFKRLEAQVKFPDLNATCLINLNDRLLNSERTYMSIINTYSDLFFEQKPDNGGYSLKFRFNDNLKVKFVVDSDQSFLLFKNLKKIPNYFSYQVNFYFEEYIKSDLKMMAKTMNISDENVELDVTTMTTTEASNLVTTELATEFNDSLKDFTNAVRKLDKFDSVIRFPDKQMQYKENLGILTITSEIYLTECSLRISSVKAIDILDEKHVYDFKITRGRIRFPNVTASCELTILKSGIHWQSRISVTAFDTPAELITVRNSVINSFSAKYRLMSEPKIKLTVDDNAVQTLVIRYHLHELSTYLSGLINDYFKIKVPQQIEKLLENKCNSQL